MKNPERFYDKNKPKYKKKELQPDQVPNYTQDISRFGDRDGDGDIDIHDGGYFTYKEVEVNER